MKRFTSFTRAAAVLIGLLLSLAVPALAQTATTSTTLSSAISDTSGTVVVVASATDVEAGGKLFIDRESMDVTSVNGTTARVRRGMDGTRAVPHISGSVVVVASKSQKASVYGSPRIARGGTCTRANEAFLPQVDATAGILWDCPVGATLWTPINFDVNTASSESFDLDVGAGTTVDTVLLRHPRAIQIYACRILYSDATSGTVAAGNAKVGITVGGAEVVAATSYENAKAVGTTTAMVIVEGKIAPGVPVIVRHTGVAATQAGRAIVQCDYIIR